MERRSRNTLIIIIIIINPLTLSEGQLIQSSFNMYSLAVSVIRPSLKESGS